MTNKVQLATLCYVQKNSKTLMLHRIKKENDMHAGKWNGLGGKMEEGETPEECAIREIKEESGLDVHHLLLKGFILFPQFDGKKDWYVFIFVIDDFSGTLIDSPEGELAWIENKRLSELPLWAGDRIFMQWLNKREFFSARFNYKKGKLLGYEVNFY